MTRRIEIAALIGLAGVLACLMGCTSSPQRGASVRLKVMTYNIRIGAGGGDWPTDPGKINLEPVARTIAELKPDIVGLQEVDRFRPRSAGMDQPAWLGERLKMNVAFAEAYSVPPKEQYGVALLARDPILSHERFPLYKPDYRKSHPEYPVYYSEQRVLMHAPVQVGGRLVHLFVTHLGLTTDQRQEQIKQLNEIISRYSGPKLLMGDFNAEPAEPGMKALEGLKDALTDAGTSAEERKSFPGGMNPTGSIDYVWVSPEFRVLSSKVIRQNEPASDHNPVVVELELLPGR